MEIKSTRDKIIDASMELFAKKGFKGTTTKLIAKEAGVNELTIFRYFGTKEGILKGVFESRLSFLNEAFYSHKKDAEYELIPDLLKLAKLYHDKLMENINLVMLILHEFETNSNIIEMYMELPGKFKQSLVEYFDEMQRRGKMKTCNSELVAVTFMSMNIGFIVIKQKFFNCFSSISASDYIETSVKTFSKGLIA